MTEHVESYSSFEEDASEYKGLGDAMAYILEKYPTADPETLAKAIDDCSRRFIAKLPRRHLMDPIKLCFGIREAYWWYQEYWITTYKTLLPRMSLEQFGIVLCEECSLISIYVGYDGYPFLVEEWKRFCQNVSVNGTILLDNDASKVVMVQKCHGGPWVFPHVKENDFQDDVICTTTEIKKELGLEISNLIHPEIYIETWSNEQRFRFYVVPGIVSLPPFGSRSRWGAIRIRWVALDDIPGWKHCLQREIDRGKPQQHGGGLRAWRSLEGWPFNMSHRTQNESVCYAEGTVSKTSGLQLWNVLPFLEALAGWVVAFRQGRVPRLSPGVKDSEESDCTSVSGNSSFSIPSGKTISAVWPSKRGLPPPSSAGGAKLLASTTASPILPIQPPIKRPTTLLPRLGVEGIAQRAPVQMSHKTFQRLQLPWPHMHWPPTPSSIRGNVSSLWLAESVMENPFDENGYYYEGCEGEVFEGNDNELYYDEAEEKSGSERFTAAEYRHAEDPNLLSTNECDRRAEVIEKDTPYPVQSGVEAVSVEACFEGLENANDEEVAELELPPKNRHDVECECPPTRMTERPLREHFEFKRADVLWEELKIIHRAARRASGQPEEEPCGKKSMENLRIEPSTNHLGPPPGLSSLVPPYPVGSLPGLNTPRTLIPPPGLGPPPGLIAPHESEVSTDSQCKNCRLKNAVGTKELHPLLPTLRKAVRNEKRRRRGYCSAERVFQVNEKIFIFFTNRSGASQPQREFLLESLVGITVTQILTPEILDRIKSLGLRLHPECLCDRPNTVSDLFNPNAYWVARESDIQLVHPCSLPPSPRDWTPTTVVPGFPEVILCAQRAVLEWPIQEEEADDQVDAEFFSRDSSHLLAEYSGQPRRGSKAFPREQRLKTAISFSRQLLPLLSSGKREPLPGAAAPLTDTPSTTDPGDAYGFGAGRSLRVTSPLGSFYCEPLNRTSRRKPAPEVLSDFEEQEERVRRRSVRGVGAEHRPVRYFQSGRTVLQRTSARAFPEPHAVTTLIMDKLWERCATQPGFLPTSVRRNGEVYVPQAAVNQTLAYAESQRRQAQPQPRWSGTAGVVSGSHIRSVELSDQEKYSTLWQAVGTVGNNISSNSNCNPGTNVTEGAFIKTPFHPVPKRGRQHTYDSIYAPSCLFSGTVQQGHEDFLKSVDAQHGGYRTQHWFTEAAHSVETRPMLWNSSTTVKKVDQTWDGSSLNSPPPYFPSPSLSVQAQTRNKSNNYAWNREAGVENAEQVATQNSSFYANALLQEPKQNPRQTEALTSLSKQQALYCNSWEANGVTPHGGIEVAGLLPHYNVYQDQAVLHAGSWDTAATHRNEGLSLSADRKGYLTAACQRQNSPTVDVPLHHLQMSVITDQKQPNKLATQQSDGRFMPVAREVSTVGYRDQRHCLESHQATCVAGDSNRPPPATPEELLAALHGKRHRPLRMQQQVAAYRKQQAELAAYQQQQEELAAYREKENQRAAYRRQQEKLAAYQREEELVAYQKRKEELLACQKREEVAAFWKHQEDLDAYQKRKEELVAYQRLQEELAGYREKEEQLLVYQKQEEQLVSWQKQEELNAYRRQEEQAAYQKLQEGLVTYNQKEQVAAFPRQKEQLAAYKNQQEVSVYWKQQEKLATYLRQEELDAYQKHQEELATYYKHQEELAAYQKRQEELAAYQKQQEEHAAYQKHQEEQAAYQKQQEEQAAYQKQQEEQAAYQKQQEEQAAYQKQQEEQAAYQKQQEEQAAYQKQQEEQAAYQNQQKEQAVYQKQHEEQAAYRKNQEELAAYRKRQEEQQASYRKEQQDLRLCQEERENMNACKRKLFHPKTPEELLLTFYEGQRHYLNALKEVLDVYHDGQQGVAGNEKQVTDSSFPRNPAAMHQNQHRLSGSEEPIFVHDNQHYVMDSFQKQLHVCQSQSFPNTHSAEGSRQNQQGCRLHLRKSGVSSEHCSYPLVRNAEPSLRYQAEHVTEVLSKSDLTNFSSQESDLHRHTHGSWTRHPFSKVFSTAVCCPSCLCRGVGSCNISERKEPLRYKNSAYSLKGGDGESFLCCCGSTQQSRFAPFVPPPWAWMAFPCLSWKSYGQCWCSTHSGHCHRSRKAKKCRKGSCKIAPRCGCVRCSDSKNDCGGPSVVPPECCTHIGSSSANTKFPTPCDYRGDSFSKAQKQTVELAVGNQSTARDRESPADASVFNPPQDVTPNPPQRCDQQLRGQKMENRENLVGSSASQMSHGLRLLHEAQHSVDTLSEPMLSLQNESEEMRRILGFSMLIRRAYDAVNLCRLGLGRTPIPLKDLNGVLGLDELLL